MLGHLPWWRCHIFVSLKASNFFSAAFSSSPFPQDKFLSVTSLVSDSLPITGNLVVCPVESQTYEGSEISHPAPTSAPALSITHVMHGGHSSFPAIPEFHKKLSLLSFWTKCCSPSGVYHSSADRVIRQLEASFARVLNKEYPGLAEPGMGQPRAENSHPLVQLSHCILYSLGIQGAQRPA